MSPGARATSYHWPKETEEFNRRIEKLDKDMEEQKSLHTILSAQIKRQDTAMTCQCFVCVVLFIMLFCLRFTVGM